MINPILSTALNQIHRWSEPEQNPMKRMFLTRFAELGCAGIEAASIFFKTLELSTLSVKQLINSSLNAVTFTFYPSLLPEISAKTREIAILTEGLASTVFFGIFFSPEGNFKIHLKLKLAVDNLAEKSQRELAAKLQAEQQKAEITKMRNERFAKLENEQQAIKEAEDQANIVNSRLAELLLPPQNR